MRKKRESPAEEQKNINVENSEQLRRLCSEFNCNEMRLKNAIRAVGPSTEAVRQYMLKKF
jgi:hypothetical protein